MMRPVLLLQVGGEFLQRHPGLGDDFQLVALAGRNERLLDELRGLAARHPGRLFPLGFTRVIERVMAASDLAITKPGGLTTSECLACGLPMIVVSPIPQVLPTGICTYEHVVSNIPHDQIVQKAVEVRGLKVQVASVPIPAGAAPDPQTHVTMSP